VHAYVCQCAGPKAWRYGEPVADVTAPEAGDRSVDRHLQYPVPARLGPVDQGPCLGSVAQHVELEPQVAVLPGAEILDRGVPYRGQAVGDVVLFRGSRNGHLPIGVRHPGVAGGAERQGEVIAATVEKGGAQVGRAHVLEDLGNELPLREGGPVLRQGHLVVGSAVDVAEHHSRQASPGCPAQVVDGQAAIEAPGGGVPLDRTELEQLSDLGEAQSYPFLMMPTAEPSPLAAQQSQLGVCLVRVKRQSYGLAASHGQVGGRDELDRPVPVHRGDIGFLLSPDYLEEVLELR
jgi:hypothetical protein